MEMNVRDEDDSKLGLYAGAVAAVMVVALSVMAFLALDAQPTEYADAGKSISEHLRLHEPNG